MINHDVTSSSSTHASTTHQSVTSVTSSEQKNDDSSQQSETEISKEEDGILEIHGGSISDRLAALQRSGSENWKKRLGGRPKIELNDKPVTPVMRIKDKPPTERPRSLLERIMKLGEAQDQWRNRVEEKDASQFTVAGKMGQMQYSPRESPVLSRKRYSPKPMKIRSKTTNIEQLSSYSTENLSFLPCSPSPLSKSQPSLTGSSCSLNFEKSESRKRVTLVSVPRADDEGFSSFFKSVKERIIEDGIKIQDEIFEFITSEAHELLTQRRSLKIKRKHASSGNPLKILASRKDLKMDYEEVYCGFAERELERMKLEQLAKSSSFALSALAGLASTEDFKSVALKKTVSTDSLSENKINLLQIKGRRYVQVRLVEPKSSSMNHGDCYILVTPSQIYCWQGEFSNVIERAKAAEVASLIQSSKDLGFKSQNDVIFIEEEKIAHADNQQAFFDALGMKADEIRAAGAPDEDELYEKAVVDTNAVYSVSNDELCPCEEYCGAVPKIEMLEPDKVFVFDYGAEMFVWRGKLASPELRKVAVTLGKDLWEQGYKYTECDINPLNASFEGPVKCEDSKRPSWTTFVKTSQHMEPVLFKEKFFDWPNIHPLIRLKKQSEDDVKYTSINNLKPCDVNSMLTKETEEPDMILEGSHIGRGVEYHDELERRHFRISTISCKVWHISEYSYKNLPIESWGQFHNCDTYVIRWHFMISNVGRTLRGNASRHSFVGRKRWAYFFWQGENSSITEKGASALMTVELNEEKGPHVRVSSGKEPPCFLNLFDGQMIVYKGKRDDTPEKIEPWKLFMLRGDMKSESVLQEITCNIENLRSRTSFVLINICSGFIFIWHGCKSANHSRDFVIAAVKSLVKKHPDEMGFEKGITLSSTEVEEGSEPDDFWEGFHEKKRELYFSLLKSELSYDFTPRLFLISSTSESLCAKEILCPFFTTKHSCPFPFVQSDLKNSSQPALFLLDNCFDVFLWQGWLLTEDSENDNLTTGSAKLRWDVNRRLALEATLQYCQGKNPDDPPKAFTFSAGCEPLTFTNIFPEWKAWDELGLPGIQAPCKMMFVQELLSQLSRDRYSLKELTQDPLPSGVDPLRLESYLTDAEFEEVFDMKKEDFYNLPSWKQCKIKKEKGLF